MGIVVAALGLLLLAPADFNEEGRKALEAQKYDLAAQAFRKAVEADPKDYSAHFHLALSYSFLNRDADATAEYKKVLELKPGLYEAELNLGIVLLRQKQASEALPYLQSAVEKKPKEFRPRLYLAEAVYAAGDYPKAEENYRLAAGLDPKSAAAQLGLGRAQAHQSRLDEAVQHFRKAAELDSNYKDALLELAALLEKKGQAADAIAIYQQFADNMAAQERLGELLVETKRPAEAIPYLEKVVAQDPTSANRLALANAYRLNKQPEKAVAMLQQTVSAEPKNVDLRLLYGRVLRDQKQYLAASQQFLSASELRPDSKEAWNELAGVSILMENYPQALAALDRVKALGQETAANYYFRAIILDKMQQYKPALENYQRFLEMSGGQNPNEEFQARQRSRIIRKELSKR